VPATTSSPGSIPRPQQTLHPRTERSLGAGSSVAPSGSVHAAAHDDPSRVGASTAPLTESFEVNSTAGSGVASPGFGVEEVGVAAPAASSSPPQHHHATCLQQGITKPKTFF
jgi:hypothetical protein